MSATPVLVDITAVGYSRDGDGPRLRISLDVQHAMTGRKGGMSFRYGDDPFRYEWVFGRCFVLDLQPILVFDDEVRWG